MVMFDKQVSYRVLLPLLLLASLGGSSHHDDVEHDRNDKSFQFRFSLRGQNRQLQQRRAQNGGVSIHLKPIRYCKRRYWGWCIRRGYPYGNFWDSAGMPGPNQDDALFATMGSVPSRSNIEYIALFSSGEQLNDVDDVVSGAQANYRWDTYRNPSEPRTVDADSVAAQFYNDEARFLPQSKTLYMTVWDPEFNQFDSSRTKTNVLQGYADYLTSKVNWSNIKGVVLAGTSRGGCLAFRLGEYLRINHAPQTTGFAIAANDAVCRVLQNEFGATSSTVDNPLQTAPSDYEAYEVDMNSQYPTSTRSRHCIWNFVTGAPVTEPIWNIQGLSHKGCSSVGGCTLLDDSGEVYFEQQWGAMTHGESGQDYLYSSETVDPILSHLDDCKDRFGWNHV